MLRGISRKKFSSEPLHADYPARKPDISTTVLFCLHKAIILFAFQLPLSHVFPVASHGQQPHRGRSGRRKLSFLPICKCNIFHVIHLLNTRRASCLARLQNKAAGSAIRVKILTFSRCSRHRLGFAFWPPLTW